MKKLAQQFMDSEVILPLPGIAATILACAAGAAQVLNLTLINVPASWHAYIAVGAAVLAYVCAKPLVGSQFRDALHLPAWVSQLITALVGAGAIVTGILPGNSLATQILTAAVTVLVGLGFGPAGSSVAPAAALRRRAKRRQKALADSDAVVVVEPTA